ncbi:MAG: hypothetical protein DHS20C05_15770 [Hyphococcus sp.]|nr:MAG: hypothetical protein DHS20C05_15770 [Marinicaulis sp.]
MSPSTQDGTPSPDDVELLEAAARPLIDAPSTALWVGFGAFIFIFFLILILTIRMRVISPARRKEMEGEIFEPAGQDAEITFDETPADDANARKKKRRKGKKENKRHDKRNTPPMAEEAAFETVDAEPIDTDQRAPDRKESKKKRGAFAGLFAKKKETSVYEDFDSEGSNSDALERDDFSNITVLPARDKDSGDLELASLTAVNDDDHEPEDRHHDEIISREDDERVRLEEERAAYEQAEYERAEYEREQEHLQAQRLTSLEAERARADMEQQRDAAYQSAREDAAREAEFERRKAEAALEQRMQSVAAMQRKLAEKADTLTNDAQIVRDQLGAALEDRFSSLSEELETKLQQAVAPLLKNETDNFKEEANKDAQDAVSLEINTLKTATVKAIDRLETRLDKINGAQEDAAALSRELAHLNTLLAERAATATAGRIQLGDVIRSILPADRYRFAEKLSTGRRADCLITMPGLSLPVPVDARFPVDAFDAYIRGEKTPTKADAKTLYERAILRHLVDISEHYIALGETADFAIMFIPSETIFNDLHANFPGVVQDSYRARVWILSPTSFMATLHMMSAITNSSYEAPRAKPHQDDEARSALLAEVTQLRARVAALESPLTDTAHHPDQTDLFENQETNDQLLGAEEEGNESGPAHENPFRQMLENTPSDHPLQFVEAPTPRSPEEVAFQRLQEEEALAELRLNKKSATPKRPPFPLR